MDKFRDWSKPTTAVPKKIPRQGFAAAAGALEVELQKEERQRDRVDLQTITSTVGSTHGSFFHLTCCMSDTQRCAGSCLPHRSDEVWSRQSSKESSNEATKRRSSVFTHINLFGKVEELQPFPRNNAGHFEDPGKVIETCQKRYQGKKDAISSLAKVSPLKIIKAEQAIEFYATEIGKGFLNEEQFTALLQDLVQKAGVSRKISKRDIAKVFRVLDFDNIGTLDYFHWISAIPLFFDGSVEVSAQLFAEIDLDSSGDLDIDEFSNYATATVNMIVPPEDSELRGQLKHSFAKRVFKAIDIDESGDISAEEFTEWLRWNCLEVAAFKALDECVNSNSTIRTSKDLRRKASWIKQTL